MKYEEIVILLQPALWKYTNGSIPEENRHLRSAIYSQVSNRSERYSCYEDIEEKLKSKK